MPRKLVSLLFVMVSPLAGAAAEIEAPPADAEPVLRIDPGGPAGFVTSLAFSPDGKTLYAAGWDKVVRAWKLGPDGRFGPGGTAFRVPVGPALDGALNALAVSPDGEWLAAAGNGAPRKGAGFAGFRDPGFIVPSAGVRDAVMLRDVGTIYLFNTRDRTARVLRGHRGEVRALTFGPRREGATPLLLAVAKEEREDTPGERVLTARLWDPDRGAEVAALPGLPHEKLEGYRPGAALWQAGGGPEGLRAAFVLDDGSLHVWKPTRKETQKVADLQNNLGLAYLAGRDRLVTAGYYGKEEQSVLGLWQLPAEGRPKWARGARLGEGYARSLTLLSRRGEGGPDLAAVSFLVPGKKGAPHTYRLRLVDLADDNLPVVQDVRLWKEAAVFQPAVAASAGGHLAVAGDPGHAVRVYSVRSLLNEDNPAPQILSAKALAFGHASFVRRGADVGLLLGRKAKTKPGGPPPDAGGGDWVFEFGPSRLSDAPAGWKAEPPAADGWGATDDGARTIRIQGGKKPAREVSLKKEEELTDYALVPPAGAAGVPLLAVASHSYGQPRLAIYDAESGEQLRECAGHTERIRSVAFAPDGRLLVSAADDGTVCVWSLTDLDTVRKRRGRLPGVAVGSAGRDARGVKVLKVEAGPARGKLAAGDVVLGLVEKKDLRPLDSPRAFYEALYEQRPGAEVRLRRGGADGGDVVVTVGQGIDERKPMFSLFVRAADRAADAEWIGWSPVGPYDVSGRKAEEYLGWHFNTGDPKAPTRFAEAGQYRKFYYRAGLLGRLVERGALGLLEPPPLPRPSVGLLVKEGGRLLPRQGQAAVVVRRPDVALLAAVDKRPLSSLKSLTWRLDDGPETEFNLERADDESFEVPRTLTRGEHRFVVTARTREAAPAVEESLLVRYQPPPPQVAYRDPEPPPVRDARYTVRIDVTPAVGGEDVRVRVRHRHREEGEKEYPRTFPGRKVVAGTPLRLEQELTLWPGDNYLEVIADVGGRGEETSAPRPRSVFYYFKARPPVIALARVVPVTARGDGEPVEADPSRPLVVRVREVKLVGRIHSDEEPLADARWDRGKDTEAVRFETNKGKEWSFEERIPLLKKKGGQTVRVRARTKNSAEVERSLTLVYQPPAAEVAELTAPRDGTAIDGDGAPKKVAVRGRLRLPEGEADSEAVVLVNDRPSAAVLDAAAGTVAGEAVLRPGDNRIQVRVSNRWGASASSEVILVRYVRPPDVKEVKTTPVRGRALIDLEARVFSPLPLDPESVRAEVNRRPASPLKQEIKPQGENHWSVRLLGLPLDAGRRRQRIVLRLGNAEAECRAPGVADADSTEVFPAPTAEFLQPRRDTTVSAPVLTVRFQVRSVGELERVTLIHDGRPAFTDVPREGEEFVLTRERTIELHPGTNRLSVEAVSTGGRMTDVPLLAVGYTPPPLRIEIAGLAPREKGAAAVAVRRGADGELTFPPAASGRVVLRGRILWSNPPGPTDEPVALRVFVNGFQQLPVPVRRRNGEAVTAFEAPLLLNRPADNRVRLVCGDSRAGEPVECRVDCRRPADGLRLHVLVLSPRAGGEHVEEEVRRALADRPAPEGRPASAFRDVRVAATLTGPKVSPTFIFFQLVQLRKDIFRRHQIVLEPQDGPSNDVLLIYYEGGEEISARGHFFETHAPADGDRFGMSCEQLADFLADLPGAHVLLLDVRRPATAAADRDRDRIARWKDDPDVRAHVVVLRCARRGDDAGAGGVRMVPVLRQALRAGRLAELVELVEKVLAGSDDRNLLVFTKYLPTELADVRVATAPEP